MQTKIIKPLIIIGLLLMLTIIGLGGGLFYKIHSHAFVIMDKQIVYVDERKNYADVITQLQTVGKLKDKQFFHFLSEKMKYPQNMKTGRYEITPGMSYLEVVRMLRGGHQTPIQLTFNNIRLKKDLAECIARQLIFPADTLLDRLNNPQITTALGFDTTTIVALFIPNTYEIYWNTSVDKFLERMKKEYDHFWTPERLKKAQNQRLTPIQVSILASIVEEESNLKQEYPIIAGLYLNRLKKGMLLQACPTVKYAFGDFTLKRILHEHTQVDSPYNTYKYFGFPPGPIRIPSIPAINGVLNATKHDYIFMCAKENFSGSHYFSVTLSEHNRHALQYQVELNRNHIR
ncbi:MAG: endolytic transglycosylase MltG [Candidatus Symbiothrix sp.]|jgi:UPF0755 protein|nr:endolytic transglycosylase MltG [Candidatus Symbiothrix sp.]